MIQGKSLISINDFSKEEQIDILNLAEEFEKKSNRHILPNHVIATLFFEPSTRTRLSFESAICRLGAKYIGFSDTSSTSVQKGESLRDTIKTVEQYSDLIIMRHPKAGSARFASEVSNVPVINAGDGANQHPTQTLLDMYSIRKTQGALNDLNIAFVGDLKYGRTVHSLVMALCNFNCNFYFVSPQELKIPTEIKYYIKERNLTYSQFTNMNEVIPKVDIIYMTRIQRERFSDPLEYEKVKNSYILNSEMLYDTKPNLKILHPLPRVNEISEDVDNLKEAYYFTQALNGVYIRQALLTSILGAKL
ncbi:MAG: aspartate carbamoyltransferase [Bacteroidetes bacterium GWF2_29_10]|nr:MAG: aspartate carbamoyltransferase [Bacteroidetes bacterium GWF2_29_10]